MSKYIERRYFMEKTKCMQEPRPRSLRVAEVRRLLRKAIVKAGDLTIYLPPDSPHKWAESQGEVRCDLKEILQKIDGRLK
mgnify:CR=1 FL=1